MVNLYCYVLILLYWATRRKDKNTMNLSAVSFSLYCQHWPIIYKTLHLACRGIGEIIKHNVQYFFQVPLN